MRRASAGAPLAQFDQKRGHFLVTNGPYQLGKWTATAVTLAVFRDFTYPLGVGASTVRDPASRAYVRASTASGDRLEIAGGGGAGRESLGGRTGSCASRSRPGPAGESTRRPLTAALVIVGSGGRGRGGGRLARGAGPAADRRPGGTRSSPAPYTRRSWRWRSTTTS